ncbi:MAG: hypothetical protein K2W97_01000 [Chthoniobacterales bacterium]|nr:hypothetical protein [Chthoniobacterales bacterium]
MVVNLANREAVFKLAEADEGQGVDGAQQPSVYEHTRGREHRRDAGLRSIQ